MWAMIWSSIEISSDELKKWSKTWQTQVEIVKESCLEDHWELWVHISQAVGSMHEYSWKCVFWWWFWWFRPISSRFLAMLPDVKDCPQMGFQKSPPKNQNQDEKSKCHFCPRNVPGAPRWCGVAISRWFRRVLVRFLVSFPMLRVSTIWWSKKTPPKHQNQARATNSTSNTSYCKIHRNFMSLS